MAVILTFRMKSLTHCSGEGGRRVSFSDGDLLEVEVEEEGWGGVPSSARASKRRVV